MVYHDVMSFDCLLSVNLWLLKSVRLSIIFYETSSNNGNETREQNTTLFSADTLPASASMPARKQSERHAQRATARAWKPAIGTQTATNR
jgi:hypothetical protein